MGKILELPTHISNQIKAGEIVERPVSVVKELVENAIDANSTQIDVFIEEGGLSKIQVVDNGEGIDSDDILIAFKRHATSKMTELIENVNILSPDKMPIKTLGFRGEALASIASVSKVSLDSSTGNRQGTFVYLEAGTLMERQASSARKGTSITVEQLFYNTPARLKFMTSLQTEVSKVADLLNRLALSHPNIAFSLTVDNNRLMKTLGNGQLKQTIAGIYSPSVAKQMMPFEAENLRFKVSGFASLPELTRAKKHFISIFLNGRYIRNFLLANAVVDGYHSKLMIGRFPIVVLNIESDYRLIDVNAHPTKETVRISQEQELIHLIKQAIDTAMNQSVRIPSTLPKRFNKTATQNNVFEYIEQSKTLQDSARDNTMDYLSNKTNLNAQDINSVNSNEAKEYINFNDSQYKDTKEKIDGIYYDRIDRRLDVNSNKNNEWVITENSTNHVFDESDNYDVMENQYNVDNPNVVEDNQFSQHNSSNNEQAIAMGIDSYNSSHFPTLHYFGQMHGTYLFAQNENGLYIVDQHAAQERIKYEYYRVKIGEVGTAMQQLLVPIVLDYPINEFLMIQDKKVLLNDVGICLSVFGQNSFIVEEHPIWISEDVETVIRDLIQMALDNNKVDIAKYREKLAVMMSCKKSIKANHYVDDKQAHQLLSDLSMCQNPYNCPHGRPVLVHLNNTDIEKMFKRIQDRH